MEYAKRELQDISVIHIYVLLCRFSSYIFSQDDMEFHRSSDERILGAKKFPDVLIYLRNRRSKVRYTHGYGFRSGHFFRYDGRFQRGIWGYGCFWGKYSEQE